MISRNLAAALSLSLLFTTSAFAADETLPNLSAAAPAAGTDLVPTTQGGSLLKQTVSALVTFFWNAAQLVNPTATTPTTSPCDSSTKVATTAFVAACAGGGGGNPSVTLTADTNIVSGTFASIDASGGAAQTWGPAPNVAGVVNVSVGGAYGEGPTNANQASVPSTLQLSATQFVVFTADGGIGANGATACSISGTTVTCGATNSSDTGLINLSTNAALAVKLSSTEFVFSYSPDGDTTFYLEACTVSTNTISCGTPLSTATADCTQAVGLSSTTFLAMCTTGTNTYVVGSVSGTTITIGTPVVSASANTHFLTFISSTSALATYVDGGNNNAITSAVVSISATVPTEGTPVAVSGSAGSTNAPYPAAVLLSSTSFVVEWDGTASLTQNSASFAAGSISGTTISFGSIVDYPGLPILATYNLTPDGGGLPTNMLSPDSTHVVVALGLVFPFECSVSGTTLTCPAQTALVSRSGVTIPSGQNVINNAIAAFDSSDYLATDAASNIYEFDLSGNVSPVLTHRNLWAYNVLPVSSTTALAVFANWNGNVQARIITHEPITNGPIGVAPSAGCTATTSCPITLAGNASGFSGLTPGTYYYPNGDGTVTTANTGHAGGYATSSTSLAIAPSPQPLQ